jgi:hypothetical protein
MADKPKLSSPHVTVVMVDGSEWSVQSLNIDMLKWERYAIKNRLPVNPGGAPVTWLSYLAWSAGIREHALPADVTWPRFEQEMCASVAADDNPSAGTVDPTEPEAGTG